MNNRNNKNQKKSMIPGLIVLAAVLAFNLVDGAADGNPMLIVVVLGSLIVLLAIAVTVAAVKKAAARGGVAERPVRSEAAGRRPPAFMRDAEQEEAIHCAHVRGKQKYIEQLDSYLKNGIIDKAEYRVLRERYEKLELPDDYH